MPAIRYLKRSAVNDSQWNACMDRATNGLIYGYTFYLDAFCTAWDALVVNDYEAVMPLPWRKKWGITYLYQPFAIAQMGLFGNELSPALLHEVLKNIPAPFKYWDMPLNFGNRFTVPPFPLFERKNYILPLHQGYANLNANYRTQLKRNLKKAQTHHCVVQRNIPIDAVTALAKKHAANEGTAADFIHFENLYHSLAATGHAVSYGVKSSTGALLASAAFFTWQGRAYYILLGNAPEGRSYGASHAVIDAFIQDHAGLDLILDFEGSDVPGLQFFYSSFGAVEENYTAIRYNRLPLYLKWLK